MGMLILILLLLMLFANPIMWVIVGVIVYIILKKRKGNAGDEHGKEKNAQWGYEERKYNVWRYDEREYYESAYYHITKQSYNAVEKDVGRYGEYLTYKNLKYMERDGAKFLFNVYIPKADEETTEIDILMICKKGIFVFESKNYSGWIFGSENQKNWYQTLPTKGRESHKEQFYNPIMQNRSHIKHLKSLLGNQIPMYSIIVFSNRCTLKSIQIQSDDVSVINREKVNLVVSEICNKIPTDIFNESDILEIFTKLYPYTQVSEAIKEQHKANIQHNTDMRYHQPVYEPLDVAETEQFESIETVENEPIETMRQALQHPKCPRCNADLVLRTRVNENDHGNQFYVCSNYPSCMYIYDIINGVEC